MTGRTNKLWLLLTLLICIVGSLHLQAQTEPTYTDLIYLKNGSVFKSRIIEYKQGDTLTVEIAGGHILRFAESDIEKISQVGSAPEQQVVVREQRKRISRDALVVKGVYGFAATSFSGQTNGTFGPMASILNFDGGAGYQFNQWLGLGLGTGYNLYDANRGESVIPVFADFRMYPFKKNLGPYFNLQAGYGFALKQESLGIIDAKGGYMFHPAIGWRVAAGEKFFFTFDIGARFQKAQYTQEDQWWLAARSVRDVVYQRTTFRVGIQIW